MSLDAGRTFSAPAPSFETTVAYTKPSVYHPWQDWQPSGINHHGRACCEIAREWTVDTDFSVLNGANPLTGPRWLRRRYEWGPGTYPIYWCEVVKKSKLDCGVLAALAYELFVSRGVRCYRAQLVQEFCDSSAMQWRAAWEGSDAITAWIWDNLIYHEGCAIQIRDNEIKLWDSSAGWWVDPKTTRGYGAIRALRITAPHDSTIIWGNHRVEAGVWTALG